MSQIVKIIEYTTIVTVYIYTVIVACVQIYTVLEWLMWEVMWLKCVKFTIFSIIEGLVWML